MPANLRLLTRGSWSESQRFAKILRRETVGGVLLLVAAGAALLWANSPWSAAYRAVSAFAIGPESLHLRLSVSAWAADGLLAIFFFVVGLELKREFVAGDLRDPTRAALPIAAAIGGMVVPAAIFIGINLAGGHRENLDGWAVPIATDIAFALAVLAVLSTHLPTALRTFLLTLAVVDDLLAITIIAIFYTDHLSPGPLALALIPIAGFGLAVQRGRRTALFDEVVPVLDCLRRRTLDDLKVQRVLVVRPGKLGRPALQLVHVQLGPSHGLAQSRQFRQGGRSRGRDAGTTGEQEGDLHGEPFRPASYHPEVVTRHGNGTCLIK